MPRRADWHKRILGGGKVAPEAQVDRSPPARAELAAQLPGGGKPMRRTIASKRGLPASRGLIRDAIDA